MHFRCVLRLVLNRITLDIHGDKDKQTNKRGRSPTPLHKPRLRYEEAGEEVALHPRPPTQPPAPNALPARFLRPSLLQKCLHLSVSRLTVERSCPPARPCNHSLGGGGTPAHPRTSIGVKGRWPRAEPRSPREGGSSQASLGFVPESLALE